MIYLSCCIGGNGSKVQDRQTNRWMITIWECEGLTSTMWYRTVAEDSKIDIVYMLVQHIIYIFLSSAIIIPYHIDEVSFTLFLNVSICLIDKWFVYDRYQ